MSVQATVSPRVLIVEDEFLVALQLEDILGEGGYQVLATIPDLGSLEQLATAPDLALVDLNLRDGLTGPEVARKVAERFGARVIYVTANPAQIDQPAPTAIGIVQKPFTRDSILAAIAFALQGGMGGERPADLVPIERAA